MLSLVEIKEQIYVILLNAGTDRISIVEHGFDEKTGRAPAVARLADEGYELPTIGQPTVSPTPSPLRGSRS